VFVVTGREGRAYCDKLEEEAAGRFFLPARI